MNWLLSIITIPIAAGLLCSLLPRSINSLRKAITIIVSFYMLGVGAWLFVHMPVVFSFSDVQLLRMDALSGMILLATVFFGALLSIFAVSYMGKKDNQASFYNNYLFTLGAACGAVLSNHFVLLLIFWGFLAITLYLLIMSGHDEASPAARKTLMIVGGSDALLLLGIICIYVLTRSLELDKVTITLNSIPAYLAFLGLVIGAFAKAGAIPLHTWIPEMAHKAPVPVTALLPAAFDKLLGIYLLCRICLHLFVMTVGVQLFLMIIGAVTLLAGVMRALVQHDLKRLLAYHAVSQVGYMIIGIATGTAIGIAGGLFHMLNNTLYKSGLFLAGGAVEQRTGTSNLDKLGGLARWMPWTFGVFLVFSLSISGIPPFNGFVSKWMIYQGLLENGKLGNPIWSLWLAVAMFGSGLTLASFMKLNHAIFLGRGEDQADTQKIKEADPGLLVPMIILAIFCIVFGIFAMALPIKGLIAPIVPDISIIGLWSPGLATMMVILGVVVGLIIYLLGNLKGIRESEPFIGGETLPAENRVTGTGFYDTIREMKGLKTLFQMAEARRFDLHDHCLRSAEKMAQWLGRCHTGVLPLYFVWLLAGMAILLLTMMGN